MNYEIINVDLCKSMTNKLMKEYGLLYTYVYVWLVKKSQIDRHSFFFREAVWRSG